MASAILPDDCGTGYSSLLSEVDAGRWYHRSGKNFNLEVVTEGIETGERDNFFKPSSLEKPLEI